jgi:prevent-host-death family protein
MGTVGVRELAHSASKIVGEVGRSGRPVVVTVHGRPVAVLVPFDESDLEDYVLAHAPEFVQGRIEAERNLAAGKTEPLSRVVAELDK